LYRVIAREAGRFGSKHFSGGGAKGSLLLELPLSLRALPSIKIDENFYI